MKTFPKPSASSPTPAGVIRGDELYSLRELQRRLSWGEHATRQARIAGLRIVRFGREGFVLGADCLAFFARLAERQEAVSDCHADGEGGK